MELAKNQEHTVTIEGYGEGGMGVARIDGRVVFVHGALRGEKCRVLILKTLKSVAFAKVLEVLEPSSERITPDCPYFPRCGGCTYRHIRYEEELRLKKQRVQDNLSRIGGSDVTVEEILGARDTLRYRNKAQYPVSKDGAVGFYRARTHEVIECEHCLLVSPRPTPRRRRCANICSPAASRAMTKRRAAALSAISTFARTRRGRALSACS